MQPFFVMDYPSPPFLFIYLFLSYLSFIGNCAWLTNVHISLSIYSFSLFSLYLIDGSVSLLCLLFSLSFLYKIDRSVRQLGLKKQLLRNTLPPFLRQHTKHALTVTLRPAWCHLAVHAGHSGDRSLPVSIKTQPVLEAVTAIRMAWSDSGTDDLHVLCLYYSSTR